jgi:DNA-binding response OmpR family regulator
MKHILVVDDDRALLGMIGNYLGSQDFRVSAVTDGRTMTRIIADDSVDLVTLDMKLADEDGLMLLRDLRAQSDVHNRENRPLLMGPEPPVYLRPESALTRSLRRLP